MHLCIYIRDQIECKVAEKNDVRNGEKTYAQLIPFYNSVQLGNYEILRLFLSALWEKNGTYWVQTSNVK